MRRAFILTVVLSILFISCEEDENVKDTPSIPEIENCLFLDGKNDYGRIDYNNNLDFTNALTIEAKIYIAEFDEPVGSKWRWDEDSEIILPIISQSHNGSSVGDYTLAVTPTRVLFGFETVDSRFSADFDFETEKWYNIALVHTLGMGSDIELYIDGVLFQGVWRDDAGDPIDGNDMSVQNTGNPYWIGANNNHADAGVFNGYIDDLCIWKIRRTKEQIENDMNSINIDENGLVSYWNFNEKDGDKVPDLKSNNDIVLVNGANVLIE